MDEHTRPAQITKKITYGGKEYDVLFRKGAKGKTREEMLLDEGDGLGFSYCAPLCHRTYEAMPGILCEQDVPVVLRDGVTIYADIYRPVTTLKVPLIVSWGIFGKRPAEGVSEWKLMGVPPQTVSPLAKFECADPAYWCYQGYAVANVDARGVGNSEGDIETFGTQDGRDGYDFIEWAAAQEWCSGKCTLFGNSGVCMAIWKIAAEQPPHLTCIAAWEGIGDLYRESFFCGGVPNYDYHESIMVQVACKNYIEDIPAMMEKYPLMNEYWEDKIVRWDKIRVPAYVSAGWVHHHLRGAVEGFRRIRSPKKWIRMHRNFEWPDSYAPENLLDLKRFYDRYLKDVHNGWEFTPRVRMDVMDAYDYDFRSARRENEFPLARTQYRKLYLNAADMGCSLSPAETEAETSYDPETETAEFRFRFDEDTEISGYMKLRLWVECRGHDNMDLFPWILKLGQDGEYLPIQCMDGFYRGAWGFLRASHRELDKKWSSDFQPVAAHRSEQRLSPGEIVPLDIEIYPTSRIWHKGESLLIRIAGRFIKSDWFHDSMMNMQTDNGEGVHVLHTGGRYDSYLQIPVIPPKYRSGDYVVR